MKIKITFVSGRVTGVRIEEIIKLPDAMHLRGPVELTKRQAQSLAKAIIARWGGVK